jgi:Cof subfamily protein (haloacid dehalogenase superfamily)
VTDENAINFPAFSRPPEAVAIDMDGTLLDSRSHLSLRTFNVLRRLLEHGFPIIIATSRAHRSVRHLLGTDIAGRCSLVTQNGSFALGRPPLSGRIKETIPRATAETLIAAALALEPELRITIEIEGEIFGTNNPRNPTELWEISSATPDMQLSLAEALKQGPAKFAVSRRGTDITYLAEIIRQRFGGTLAVYEEKTRDFLNVTMASAGKTNSLRRLLETKNLSLQNTVAIGDDLPDYDMLAACGYSVAMGNAVPEIKALCRYHTASNDEDGAAQVLEKILCNQIPL